MKKLIFLIVFLTINLFGNDEKYFFIYEKDNNYIKKELKKEGFDLYYNEFLNGRKLTYLDDYKIVKVFKEKVNKNEVKKTIKKVDDFELKIKQVEKVEEVKETIKEVEKIELKNEVNFIGIIEVIFILIIMVYFFYYTYKTLQKPIKKEDINEVEKVENEDNKKSKEGDEKTSTYSKEDKEEIIEDNNINLMYYNELDKERKKLRKDFMNFKTKKDKKKIYQKFTKLNNDIKNKEDINVLNKDFQLILKDIERLKDE